MVTSLKKIISNPIVLAIIVTCFSIGSYLGISESYIGKRIEQSLYLRSREFSSILADVTSYLGTYKLDHVGTYESKYETLKDLQYYIRRGTVYHYNQVQETKTGEIYFIDEENFFNQFMNLKNNSDFYLHVVVERGQVELYESSIKLFMEEVYSGGVRSKIKGNEIPSNQENYEVYFFIPKGQILENDYLSSGIGEYKNIAQKFIFLSTQLCGGLIYLILLVISSLKKMNQKTENQEIEKQEYKSLPIEVIILIYIGLGYGIREIVKFITDIGMGDMNIICGGNVLLMVGYAIVSTTVLMVIGYTVQTIFSVYYKRFKEGIKENSIVYKMNIPQKLQTTFGIDLRKSSYTKIAFLNLVHVFALCLLVYQGKNEFIVSINGLLIWNGIILCLLGAVFKDGKQILVLINNMGVSEKVKVEIENLKKYKVYMIISLGLYNIILFFIFYIGYRYSDIAGYILVSCVGIAIAILSWKVVKDLRQIYFYSEKILDMKFPKQPNVSILSPIIVTLSQIEERFGEAVRREVISQKMKTELISNVSHDLKTPLTSLISYIDLLKKKETTEEDKGKYIDILDKQSQRLKVLIEDLVEASKAASGNIELVREEIDLVDLLKQTLGEMGEKIDKSNLQFKVNLPQGRLACQLDGRRTYRIFENLIGNILKYAAPYSRVYIDCTVENQEVILIFRNISAGEMHFTAEEIVERFKRGDESRHTEGSGLGLAIAKNLTELQGGKFDIYIDGDLFKVILRFDILEMRDL